MQTNYFNNGYALVIGIANYPKVRPLPAEVLKDAADVADILISPEHCGYPADHVKKLLDSEATADDIREGLRWLSGQASADDTALIYFSGHGGRITDGAQTNYLIPFDCDPLNIDSTAISGDELTGLLRDIRAQRLLVFFDACYSGGAGQPKALGDQTPQNFKEGLGDNYFDQLKQGSGRVIMASSRTDEVSLILPGMSNSLFTHYLLEALRGSTRTRSDGQVRVFDLFDYVSEKVPARANQHPIFKASDVENNYPVALYLGGEKAAPGSEASQPTPTKIDNEKLLDLMKDSFTSDDLQVLAFRIQSNLDKDEVVLDTRLSLDEFAGGKTLKITQMIGFLENRRLLPYLVTAVRRARPGII